MEREILVTGYANVRSTPDRAIVRVSVESESRSSDTAYAKAAEISGEVDRVVENRKSAVWKVTAASLVIHATTRREKHGEREDLRTYWVAARTSTLEVVDFDQLSELIAELAGAGAAIVGPLWVPDDDNPAYRELRRADSHDARRRAEDYARGLGLGVEGVSWISEPGLRVSDSVGERGYGLSGSTYESLPRGEESTEIIAVGPEEITVTDSVEVAFTVKGMEGS